MNNKKFKLIMINATMEGFGNMTNRFFDNHPNLKVFPFEFQTGNQYSTNTLSTIYPYRYFWPQYPEGTTFERAYDITWNEELRCLLRVPDRSKFKNCGLIMDEKELKQFYLDYCKGKPFCRRTVIEALLVSTFQAWKNYNKPENPLAYLAYNPGMVANTPEMFQDFGHDLHIIHVVRSVYSGYSDYLKRPYPQQTLSDYCTAWNLVHLLGYNYSKKYSNYHIIKVEDFILDKRGTLQPILDKIGIPWSDTLLYPSFNGKDLSENVVPWGSIKKPTYEFGLEMANQLTLDQKLAIKTECSLMLDTFKYQDFEKLIGL